MLILTVVEYIRSSYRALKSCEWVVGDVWFAAEELSAPMDSTEGGVATAGRFEVPEVSVFGVGVEAAGGGLIIALIPWRLGGRGRIALPRTRASHVDEGK